MTTVFQPSLFAAEEMSFDSSFADLRRIDLDARSWVEVAPGWARGADALFERILAARKWAQRTRRMYDGRVLEPRLTAPWNLRSGVPVEPRILEEMRLCLSRRYGIVFDSIGFNFYRDGRDSVAWHSDKIHASIEEPVVALVSVGEPRRFLLRPKGGGRSVRFDLGRGDLLVTGGKAQRDWEHCVPKVAHAGPRISLAFRHGMLAGAYGESPPARA
ncbi:MAG: alpha-ketoglutarate-dependent dioxygenase AlkB [Myxococcales bacterium]